MRQVKNIYINKTNNPIRESTQTPETKELSAEIKIQFSKDKRIDIMEMYNMKI